MTDQIAQTPGQQETTPGQQAPAASGSTAPEGFIELARYNGLVKKVEELTLSNRTLSDQLTQKTSEAEQLKGQLAVKDTEKTVAVSERDKKLQETLTTNTALQKELDELRGLKLKVEVANELGHPELMKIAGNIPNLTDKEALKVVMSDFAGFVDTAVKAREQQLLAGVTPMGGGPAASPAMPANEKGWEDYINKFDLGTSERAESDG